MSEGCVIGSKKVSPSHDGKMRHGFHVSFCTTNTYILACEWVVRSAAET